jgi:nitroreductase
MNSFYDLLKSRRSIRKYLSTPVEPDKISQITNAALMSPASKRSNPWEFVVVQDKEMLQKLSECRPYESRFLKESPLGIVVLADTTKSDIWIEDASIAAIIMQLQAQDEGLTSCWIQVYRREKDNETTTESYIRQLLDIPEHFAVLCILSIGYPNEVKKMHDENNPAGEKIHFEKFN